MPLRNYSLTYSFWWYAAFSLSSLLWKPGQTHAEHWKIGKSEIFRLNLHWVGQFCMWMVAALFRVVSIASIQQQWSRLCWCRLNDCRTSTCSSKVKASWIWCVHSRHCGHIGRLSHCTPPTLIWLNVPTCGHTAHSLSTTVACRPSLMWVLFLIQFWLSCTNQLNIASLVLCNLCSGWQFCCWGFKKVDCRSKYLFANLHYVLWKLIPSLLLHCLVTRNAFGL